MMSNAISRGELWLQALVPNARRLEGLCPSVQAADGELNGETARFIAVVPDANNHYPRAAKGEVGLLEGWTLAKVVSETVAADADNTVKRPIVAVIDVPSQAYGRREEGFGIHQALAGAAAAYANARLAGHPVIGLIVGKAMSGAFLAHGYQANRLIAFNDKGVLIHAMGKESAARITLRTVESLEKLADEVDESAKEAEKALTPFIDRVKALLGERVKDVRLTHRLTDTPAIVSTDADEMSTQMAKLFAAAGQKVPEVKYIFELNPDHVLVKRAADTEDEAKFSEWVELLLDQALLAERGTLEDPNLFIRRMNQLLVS